MMVSRIKWAILILVCLVVWVVTQIPDGRVHVVFCDVGQGDAELISRGSVQILIDGGPRGDKLLDCLSSHMPFWDRTIEVVINSHPQADHASGLIEVIERYSISQFVRATWPETQLSRDLMGLLKSRRVTVNQMASGGLIKVGGLEVEVLWPMRGVQEDGGEENEDSLVAMLKFGEFEALFTGDIGTASELALIDRGLIGPVEVLKGAHHGSKYSSSVEFVNLLRPKLVVFEVGEGNSYGHPNGDILNRFDMVGAKIRRTDEEGTVEVVTDGRRWWQR